MAVATSQALNDTIVASSAGEAGNAMERAIRFAIVAIALAGVPLVAFALRTRTSWSVSTLVMVALPLAGVAVAWAIDAAGAGPEHGLEVAYPRRLNLLVAYAALIPLALIALRRWWKTTDTLRDGVALAAALAGLQWLALGPGLLLVAPPPAQDPAPKESTATPAGADEPPPPPPLSAPLQESREVAPVVSTDGDVLAMEGVATDGVEGGPVSAYMPPLPTTTAEAVTLAPDVLSGLRISGENPVPPSEWYGTQERMVVTVAVEVDAAGRVTRVQLLKRSGNDRLDELVMNTLMTWRYRPWAVDGRFVPVRSSISLIFVAR
jgi:TonB family protein